METLAFQEISSKKIRNGRIRHQCEDRGEDEKEGRLPLSFKALSQKGEGRGDAGRRWEERHRKRTKIGQDSSENRRARKKEGPFGGPVGRHAIRGREQSFGEQKKRPNWGGGGLCARSSRSVGGFGEGSREKVFARGKGLRPCRGDLGYHRDKKALRGRTKQRWEMQDR